MTSSTKSLFFFFTILEKDSTIIIGDNVKDNNYDDIPINEEYIPRHASNDNSLNYNKDRNAAIHNWNEEFTRQNNYNTSSTDYKLSLIHI